MGKILGTQEFMAAHKDHTTIISVVRLVDTTYALEVVESGGHLFAVLGEPDHSRENIQDFGAYVFCSECDVEEEINLGEVIEND